MVKKFGPTVAPSSVGWISFRISHPRGGKGLHTVDDYANYRVAHRDGMAIRRIARTFPVSRRTVRETLAFPEPKPYTRTKPPPAPALGPFTAIIAQVLCDHRDAPAPDHRPTRSSRMESKEIELAFPEG